MTKPDARLLNPTTQNYLRQQAIRLREQGKRTGEIAVYLGVHRTTVSGWWRQYQQEGSAALNQQSRGAKFGEGRTLSPAEEATAQRLLQENFPDELNIDSASRTRAAVSAFNCLLLWSRDADTHGRRVSQALGLYSPKTAQTR